MYDVFYGMRTVNNVYVRSSNRTLYEKVYGREGKSPDCRIRTKSDDLVMKSYTCVDRRSVGLVVFV